MSYDNNPRDLAATLSQMQRQALNKCNGNQIEAAEHVKRWVSNDRRFDQFNAERLVTRAEECRTTGATLNLEDDPNLLKARPGNRYGAGRVAS
jgi:hypothetical protein